MNEKANILHESNEKKQKVRAGVITGIIFSGVLLLCFFLIAFTIPDPPLGEQYVAVGFANLGSVDDASGTTESETPSEVVEEVIEEVVSAPSITDPVVTEEIVTQEISEIAIPVQQTEVEEEKPVVEPEPVRVSAAANLIRSDATSGGGGSQGSSESVGNQGDEDGQIEGVVSGDFGDASLDGGTLVNAPRLKEKPKKKGVIRIDIKVDSNGKVLSAKFDGGLNSTLYDAEHIRLAREAALSATFSPNASIPRRSGFITIRFELE